MRAGDSNGDTTIVEGALDTGAVDTEMDQLLEDHELKTERT
jgi:hypothetical protein